MSDVAAPNVLTRAAVVGGSTVTLYSRDGELWCASIEEYDRTKAAQGERLEQLRTGQGPVRFGSAFVPRSRAVERREVEGEVSRPMKGTKTQAAQILEAASKLGAKSFGVTDLAPMLPGIPNKLLGITLCSLMKEGRLDRVGRGTYRLANRPQEKPTVEPETCGLCGKNPAATRAERDGKKVLVCLECIRNGKSRAEARKNGRRGECAPRVVSQRPVIGKNVELGPLGDIVPEPPPARCPECDTPFAATSAIDPDAPINFDLVWRGSRIAGSELAEYVTSTSACLRCKRVFVRIEIEVEVVPNVIANEATVAGAA